jgi:Nucleotidyltransferase of unknown function (DUF6036)
MRRLTDLARLRQFMSRLGRGTREPTTVYFTGGATALLHGFRETTIDIDIKIEPDRGDLLGQIPAIKEELQVNVELASPDLFIPVSAGWEERSPLVTTVDAVTFRHFDPVAQALAKIERGHERDLRDVRDLAAGGHVRPHDLRAEFDRIEPELYRFPAIDPASMRRAVEHTLAELEGP